VVESASGGVEPMVAAKEKDSNSRLDATKSTIAYGGWISQLIIIYH
jgi:hypothetical protein